jgi:hypothetical protein
MGSRTPRSGPLLPKWLRSIPAISAGAFALLYALSAWLYPGGTWDDPTRVGFSLASNYWCDLLDATTYGGHPNPGRPYAIVAMIVLCTGLSVLWWTVPALFRHAPRRGRVVRFAGFASAVATPLVATHWHDVAIYTAGAFGVVAFAVTMSAIGNRGGRASRLLAASTLLLALVNFMIWQTRAGIKFLPIVQKAAFVAFLCWIVFTSRRVARCIGTAANPSNAPRLRDLGS